MLNQNVDIKSILINANRLISDTNFDQALLYYYQIEKIFEQNNFDEETTKLYELYKDSMIIYFTLNEGIMVARNNDMNLLKEKLDFVYHSKKNLLPRITDEKLAKYLDDGYHYLLGFYMYNFYKKKFLREFENIYYFMEAGWIDKATLHYNNHLMNYYNKLVNYGDHNVREMLYNSLINLNRDLKLNNLKQQAYSEIAGYTFSNLKRSKITEKIEHTKKQLKTMDTIKFDKKSFKKLRDLIQNDRTEAAIEMYNQIL